MRPHSRMAGSSSASADALGGLRHVGQRLLREPQALLNALPGTARDLASIGRGSSDIRPAPSDKRFRDPAWNSSRFYRTLMQTYLCLGSRADDLVNGLGLEGHAAGRARFAVGLIRDALAPTNTVLTNPEALRVAVQTRGDSLKKGAGNLIDDLRHNHGMIAQVDRSPFTIGTDLAATPGAVIYSSEVCELIQYRPQRTTVHERPLLIVPPQVNKYYALDLAPGRSMCEHLLKQGYQVFTISWRNPTAAQRDWNFDTYAQEVIDVIDVVREVTGSPDVNLMGGCLGGMMVAIVAAVLAARGDNQRVLGDRRSNAAGLRRRRADAAVRHSGHHGGCEAGIGPDGNPGRLADGGDLRLAAAQ